MMSNIILIIIVRLIPPPNIRLLVDVMHYEGLRYLIFHEVYIRGLTLISDIIKII